MKLTSCTNNHAYWEKHHQMDPWRVNFLPELHFFGKQKVSRAVQHKTHFQAYESNAEHGTGHQCRSDTILKQNIKKLIKKQVNRRQGGVELMSNNIEHSTLLVNAATEWHDIPMITEDFKW